MMKHMRQIDLVSIATASDASAQSLPASAPEFFEEKIRPVLVKNCYSCHTTSQMSGLRVDSAEGMAAIAELGCEMAQGFYIGRPMRADLIGEWIDHYAATVTMRKTPIVREWPEVARA